ncbi:fibronectin type III-like domain-contianing protein [Alkalibacterium olivapovliticus]|uniref:Fibronectin type III domain protein n=1 Tax=Alkalibacterium olivapovliticus TaxID=99907 RepID=A0A2T0VUJ1_9LACT|nr:fibronectin type III-like domain-contianing protein [Alkalibacterium olivapovliticus]PRY75081.1 fibronectin type III domain protein [Alkalibacterium olivapovliticus]
MTYGELKLTEATLSKTVWKKDDTVSLTVELSNEYDHSVTDTIQVYANLQPKQELALPNKQLIAFKKITLKALESRKVKLEIESEELCYFDVFWNRMAFPSGEGTLSIGFSSENILRTVDFQTDGEIRGDRHFKEKTHFENYDDYEGAFITLDRSSKKAVKLSPEGWLKFRDVSLSNFKSICLVEYSSNEEGTLTVYSDSELNSKIGEVHFKEVVKGEIELQIKADPGTSLYFTTSHPVFLRTIEEK